MDNLGPYIVLRFSHKERSIDRFLLIQTQPLTLGQQAVTSVITIEIENRWHPAREIGAALAQTFTRALLKSQNKSILTKFEDALKKVNHLLANSEEKITEPIHCTLTLLVGDEIYFSAINAGTIFLVRNNRFTEVTPPEKDAQEFSSVTSGELGATDSLIFPSQLLANALQQADRDLWQNKSRKAVIAQVIGEVDKNQQLNVAGLVIEYSPKSPRDETIFLEEVDSRLPVRLPKFSAPKFNFRSIVASLEPLTDKIKVLWQRLLFRPTSSATPDRWTLVKKSLPLAIFILIVIIGLKVIQNRIRQTQAENTVSTPTIASLISGVSIEETPGFLSANLTENNYQALSSEEETAFAQTLQTRGISLISSSAQVAELGSPIFATDSTDKKLYLLDTTGQLWAYDGKLIKIGQKTLINEPTSVVAMADDRVLVSDQAGTIWLFDGSPDQPVSLALPGQISTGPKLLQKYLGNLYIYDVQNQLVHKITRYGRDIVNPTTAAKTESLGLGEVTDWVITGQFIAVNAAGLVRDFRGTQLGRVAIQHYAGAFPVKLTLLTNTTDLVIVRGKMISYYSLQTNAKTKEQALIVTEPISDVAFGPNQQLWVTAGKKLYRIN